MPETWDSLTHTRTSKDSERFKASIAGVAQTVNLYTFDPVPVGQNPYSQIRRGKIRNGRLIGYQGDMDDQLDPTNDTYGYTVSVQTVGLSFQDETESVTTEFEELDTAASYVGNARLYIPPDVDMSRRYALFASGNDLEPATYKHTVFCLRHFGKVFALEHLLAREFADTLAFYDASLIEVQVPNMGATSFYVPWGQVYRLDSEKPYATYPAALANVASLLSDWFSNEPY